MQAWVSYLEMTDPTRVPAVPPPKVALSVSRERPPLDSYLKLFYLVGERVQWDLRTKMPATALAELIAGPELIVMVLRIGCEACGLCEFQLRPKGEIELMFFGIAAEHEGKGIGRYFLTTSLKSAWALRPTRIWLHTDEFDSAKALPLYLSTGFSLVDRRYEDVLDY